MVNDDVYFLSAKRVTLIILAIPSSYIVNTDPSRSIELTTMKK